MTTPATVPAPASVAAGPRKALLAGFAPLVLDAGAPIAAYYLLRAAGTGTLGALAVSSVLPAGRIVWGWVRDRRINALAGLILAVSVVGLLLSTVTGDARLMLAKDSGVSSTIGLVVLVSALRGRPLMSSVLRPWLTRGRADRDAARERLSAGSDRFRRAERRFSVLWGAALLAECVVRVVGAYTVPVDTMVWLGAVVVSVTITLAFIVSGPLAVVPMVRMIEEETRKDV
ncbi:VC0807 family protein [Streptomyces sp. NPDC060022]|uniref:VC0807 family protein n=1 Tax=Streptomyces sp. NPDC060022 TaxID=3347039 RepID=UPI00368BC71E